ncbi:hypothetical protein MMPV_005424 [Pyropia vietnamensis]
MASFPPPVCDAKRPGPPAAVAANAATAAAIAANAALPSMVELPLPAVATVWLYPVAAAYADILSPSAALSRSVRQVLEYAAAVTGWDGRALASAAIRPPQSRAAANRSVESGAVAAVYENSDAAGVDGGPAYVMLTSRPLLFLRNVAHWLAYGAAGCGSHCGGSSDPAGDGVLAMSETRCAAIPLVSGEAAAVSAAAAAAADADALSAALAATLNWARSSVGEGQAGGRRLFRTRWAPADTMSLWAELGVFRNGLRAPEGRSGNRRCERDSLVVSEGKVQGAGGVGCLDELVVMGEVGDGGSTPRVRPRRKGREAGTTSPVSVMLGPPVGSPPPLVGGEDGRQRHQP